MRFDQLEWFCNAYETRSFVKAAELAYISRQALGKAMTNLEAELGAPLFERDASGVRPTELAELIYPKVRICLSDITDIIRIRDDYFDCHREKIRFVLADGVAAALPDDFLGRLEEENPYVEFLVEKHFVTDCLALMREGKADFGIISGPTDDPSLQSIPLSRHPVYVATSDRLMHLNGEVCSFDSLADLTFFVLGDDFPNNSQFIDILEAHGIVPKLNSQFKDYDIVVREVQRGHGATIVPDNCLDQVRCEGLSIVPFPDPSFCWEVDFLYIDHTHTASEERVIDFMRRYADKTSDADRVQPQVSSS